MDDEELRVYLGLTPKEAISIIPYLTRERRRSYEHMAKAEEALNRGETPPGVIVCRPHI